MYGTPTSISAHIPVRLPMQVTLIPRVQFFSLPSSFLSPWDFVVCTCVFPRDRAPDHCFRLHDRSTALGTNSRE